MTQRHHARNYTANWKRKDIIFSFPQQRETVPARLSRSRTSGNSHVNCRVYLQASNVGRVKTQGVKSQLAKSCMSHQHAWWSRLLLAEMAHGSPACMPTELCPRRCAVSLLPSLAMLYAAAQFCPRCNGGHAENARHMSRVLYTTARLSAKVLEKSLCQRDVFVAGMDVCTDLRDRFIFNDGLFNENSEYFSTTRAINTTRAK